MAVRRQRLTQRRRTLGLSQDQFAERVGVDRSTVVRWERGDTEPHPWHRPNIARVLNVTVDELADMLTGHTLSQSPASERLDHALTHPASTDLVSVACLRQQLTDLGDSYDTVPSAALLADAGQCLGQIGFLRHHAGTSRVQRELAIAESEAATLMSKLVWDASSRRDQATPLSFLDRAITAARQLGDKTAEGHALLRKSYIALYGSRNAKAGQQLASAAAVTARHASNALTGLALLHAAEGYAMLGERRSCEQSLTEAETFLHRADSNDAAADLVTPAQFGRLAGSCYLYLREAKRAQQTLQATAEELVNHQKSRAIVLGNLTLACIRQQDLDQAVAYLNDAINVIEQTWGGGGLTLVFTAGRELRPWRGEPVVHDVYDRLLVLLAVS